jgi:nucleoside-diphosphate-sugar epimerase
MMNRVLVTGANGFVGSNLAEALLARGDDVTCVVRKSADTDRLKRLGFKPVYYDDVNDLEGLRRAVAGKDVVYHVAGLTRTLRKERFREVNEQGVRGVAQVAAEQADPPVVVVVSSLAAAGPSTLDRPRCETDPPAPVSEYGRSKLAGERAAREWADRVPITIVRPAIVLGPADESGLAMFRPVSRFGIHAIAGPVDWRYSIIHAADLAELLILAAERGARIASKVADDPVADDPTGSARGCYFAAGEMSPTWAELGRMVADAVGRRRVLMLPIPRPGVWTMAATIETLSRIRRRALYLNLDKAREVTAGSWTCSTRAATEELGFSVGAALPERLRRTAQWYRDEGWL